MKKIMLALALSALSLGLLAGSAAAVPYSFHAISNNSGMANAVAPQLQMDVTQTGANVMFSFTNTVGIASNVQQIYFDDLVTPLLSFLSISSTSNAPNYVYFGSDAPTPNDLPGGNTVGFVSSYGYDADRYGSVNQNSNGINLATEQLDITFTLLNSNTYDDLIAALGSGDFRVGMHVQGINGGTSDGFVNNAPVPEPATMLLLGTGMSGLAAIARRRKNA